MNILTGLFDLIKRHLVMIFILFFALCLRLPGFLYGLPMYPDADEPVIIDLAVKALKGHVNPHWFIYPSFYIYLNACVIGIVHLLYHSLHALGFVSYDSTPYWLFFAAGRLFNILISLITIVFVYRITILISTRKAAFFASFILAVLPLHAMHTVRIVPNMITLITVTIAIFSSLKYYHEIKRVRWLYAAAFFSGLALGAKYMFFAPLSFIIAKWFKDRNEQRSFFDVPLFVSLGIVIITFLLTTPFAVVSFREFIELGPLYASNAYSDGPSEFPLWFYITSLFNGNYGATPVIFLFFICGGSICLKNKTVETLIVAITPLAWLLFCSFYKLAIVRQMIVLSIPIAVFSAIFIQRFKRLWVQALLVVVMSISPLIINVKRIRDHRKPDMRYAAAEWINKNLPAGSKIAREEYTPYLDDTKFKCFYINISGLAYISPDSLHHKNFDYVISAGYERFESNRRKYAKHIKTYTENINRMEVVKIFHPGSMYSGNVITVFKMRQVN